MMRISYKKIKTLGYLYIFLPVLCFFSFYIDTLYKYPFILISLFCIIYIIINIQKDNKYNEKIIVIPVKVIVFMVIVAVVWTFLGGMGNHYYQSHDWNWRNAIFRDLIYKDWPVIYPEYDKALVYYIGFWLPSASIIKIIGKLVPVIYESDIAFNIGNQILWIWAAVGILLVEFLLYSYVNPDKKKRGVLIPIILVFFSGLDVVGVIIKILTMHQTFPFHIEWWMEKLQFSSNTTCLFWVFNQTILSWIIILLIINDISIKDFVFLGVCSLVSGPIPFLGLFFYMVGLFIYELIMWIRNRRGKNKSKFFKEIVSLQNILCLFLYPVLWLYYSSNASIGTKRAVEESINLGMLSIHKVSPEFLSDVVLFLIVEVVLYFIILFRFYYRNPFYYITIILCIICPFISIGTAYDFTMRASIPAVMVITAMCSKIVINGEQGSSYDDVKKKANRFTIWLSVETCRVILIILLSLGAVTAFTEFGRGYFVMLQTGEIQNVDDEFYSFDREVNDTNFQVFNYSEKVFFRIFSKGAEDEQ